MILKFIIYGAGNILTGLIPFLLLPYLTKNLSPEQMGTVAFFESFIMLLSPIVIFGIDGSYCSFYNKYSRHDLNRLVVALITLTSVIALLLTPFLFIISKAHILPVIINPYWIILMPILFYGLGVNALACAVFQMDGRALNYGVYRIAVVGCSAAVTIIAISNFKLGAEGRLLGIFAGPVVLAFGWITCLVLNTNYNFKQISVDLIKRSISFGFGMLLHSWSAIIFFASDRLILGYFVDSESLGQFSVASQIGMIMALAQNTFSQVWTPHVYKLFTNKDKLTFRRHSLWSILVLSLVSGVTAALVPLIYEYLIDARYGAFRGITYWVIATYFMLGIYKIYVVKLFYFEKTKELALITTSCTLFNVILTILLVMHSGVLGGAISTFISSILFAGSVYWRGRHFY